MTTMTKNKTKICPVCGVENQDNWPLKVDGYIKYGGCQICWEAQCSEDWWNAVEFVFSKTEDNSK
jgi:RNA polymerase subunit RPABC4/transcription elongation factor Spt4